MESPNKFDLYHWHRALGVLAFVLVIIRLITRLNANTPPTPVGLPAHEKLGSTLAHWALYGLMFALPLTGYIASSALPEFPGIPPLTSIWFFGLELPLLPIEKNYDITTWVIGLHYVLGLGFIAVLALHIAGALKHRFFDKPENDVLSRML
ncbi:cytochrome b/b6 domain-containing protein [Vibrio sp. RE88]|uniref:cytochrome b n=1 Tax=Vibrio sp. RE88 TaxID=2607610 RepID=UPI0016A2DBB7|nr:cytochrome b [Vibrio sp. RE88]